MRKLAKKAGFSLAETLITVAVLAIVTAGGAAVTGQIISTRTAMIQAADSQVLASTALEALADEIRFGQELEVEPDGKSIRLYSTIFGYEAKISLDSNGRIVIAEQGGTGGDEKQLLAGKAYTGLRIDELKFEEVSGDITISLKVVGRNGVLWEDSLTVRPLNKVKKST